METEMAENPKTMEEILRRQAEVRVLQPGPSESDWIVHSQVPPREPAEAN